MYIDTYTQKVFRLPGRSPITGWTEDGKHPAFEAEMLEHWLTKEKFDWTYEPSEDMYIIYLGKIFEDEGEWCDSINAICDDGVERSLYMVGGDNWPWEVE